MITVQKCNKITLPFITNVFIIKFNNHLHDDKMTQLFVRMWLSPA